MYLYLDVSICNVLIYYKYYNNTEVLNIISQESNTLVITAVKKSWFVI